MQQKPAAARRSELTGAVSTATAAKVTSQVGIGKSRSDVDRDFHVCKPRCSCPSPLRMIRSLQVTHGENRNTGEHCFARALPAKLQTRVCRPP